MNAKHLTIAAAFAALSALTLPASAAQAAESPAAEVPAATAPLAVNPGVAARLSESLQPMPATADPGAAGFFAGLASDFALTTNACLLLGALAAMVLLARRRGLG